MTTRKTVGPPRSTTEEEIPVNVAMLPVVLSVKGKQVMIESKEKDNNNNLLRKGSFMWISTETRVPLGTVDEVFGTVEKEKPCYRVRLESKSQVPEGIKQGTVVTSDSQLSPVMPQAIALVPQYHPLAANFAPIRHETNQQNPIQSPVLRNQKPNSMMYSPQDFISEMLLKPDVLGFGKSKNRRISAPSRPMTYSPQDFRMEMLPKPRPELNVNLQRKPKLHYRGGGRGFIVCGEKGRDQQQKP